MSARLKLLSCLLDNMDEREGRLEDFFLYSPDLLSIVRKDGILLLVCKSWTDLGWQQQDLEGKVFLQDLVHISDIQTVMAMLSGGRTGGTIRILTPEMGWVTTEWRAKSRENQLYCVARIGGMDG